MRRQAIREFASILRLTALVAAHVEGMSDQDYLNFVLGGEPVQFGEVGPDVGPLKRGKALGGDSQRVAQSQPDPLFSYIQSENSRPNLVLHNLSNYSGISSLRSKFLHYRPDSVSTRFQHARPIQRV